MALTIAELNKMSITEIEAENEKLIAKRKEQDKIIKELRSSKIAKANMLAKFLANKKISDAMKADFEAKSLHQEWEIVENYVANVVLSDQHAHDAGVNEMLSSTQAFVDYV